MTRFSHGRSLLPAIAIALGTLALGSSAALADQYPRNWEIESTGLPAPIYEFLPGHNARMLVPGATAQNAASTANSPVKYDFVPGSTTFHHIN